MSNSYNRFKSLVGGQSTDVVTIVSVGSDTSEATTLAGDTVTVIGTSVTAGQKAFVRNGEIIRQAPNLTPSEVTI